MRDKLTDLKLLQYFIYVAEFESFTRASEFLNVGQPVLSRKVRKLEVDLGKNLFIRDGRGVKLTETGQVLLDHSRGILHQVDKAIEDIMHGQLTGTISIGLPPTIAQLFSVPLTKKFHELLPHANLIINEGLTATIERGITSGLLDMGLLHNSTKSKDLDISMLAKEYLYLIAPKNFSLNITEGGVSLDEVVNHPLILPSHPNTYRQLIEIHMARISEKPTIVLEMNSVNTILKLVVEGMGCAILSSKVVKLLSDSEKKKIQAKRIHSPYLISRLYIATTTRRALSNTEKMMLNLIRNLTNSHFNLKEI